jgi:tetratricopeptide (TPR) repeat protein
VAVTAEALDIFRQLGDQGGQAEALNETGSVRLAQADPLRALACFQRGLELARTTGSRLQKARALEGLGKCAAQASNASTADSALRQALEIYQRLGAADAARLSAELDGSPGRPALVRHSADAMSSS